MTRIVHSLIWAAAILAAAAISAASGIGDDASLALVLGLTSVAWVSLYNPATCGARAECAR